MQLIKYNKNRITSPNKGEFAFFKIYMQMRGNQPNITFTSHFGCEMQSTKYNNIISHLQIRINNNHIFVKI